MASTGSPIDLTMVTWNLLLGGIDKESEERRLQQLEFLASIQDLDVFWAMEATGWHEDNDRRFRELADTTGLTALPYVTSHVGDGRNHSCLYFRADKLRLIPPATELARGAFHHGVTRAVFDVDGIRLLLLGAHLAYADGETRLREAHHLADYGQQFGEWPEDAVLLMDANGPDDNDPEPENPESWAQIPRNLWHRYREILPDGSFGSWDRRARRLLLNSGWRDPQASLPIQREPTVGYWYDNEPVPLRLDQALVTGQRIEVVDYRTLNPEVPDLTRLSDHLPTQLGVRLHRRPISQAAEGTA
ncbi:endonuclease/exonuclease/phosphatase family protein [Streptomyces sp. NPDC002589]|uniref:endonuclease/exonuclease/phosphatase family protein n=1 Tax=Streptomyces sp. NPDC002589 TaxID=3154420 RepID=UPI00332A8C93